MELFRALGCLLEAPTEEHRRLAELLDLGPPPNATEHTSVFVLALYPYASVYLGAGGQLGGEARDRIAGFWRVLGEPPPKEPDHLVVLLATYARLAELEDENTEHTERWRHARLAFLWEHLLSWLPVYLDKLSQFDAPFYSRWAELAREALESALSLLDPNLPRPLHLRAAPALPDPREEGGKEFSSAVLSPVQSGLILTASDLARAAQEIGLGTRRGERRFQLQILLDQDASAVLEWLSREAASAGQRYQQLTTPCSDFWIERAQASQELFAELSEQAAEISKT